MSAKNLGVFIGTDTGLYVMEGNYRFRVPYYFQHAGGNRRLSLDRLSPDSNRFYIHSNKFPSLTEASWPRSSISGIVGFYPIGGTGAHILF